MTETQDELLTIDIDGWEGPLDILLDLARRQKVDLRAISILELVEQYLVFIDDAEKLRLELAADYLVMAAWLAYLKSALLLPSDPEEEPSAEELALRLRLRLERLDAMRDAGARLMARDRLGRDVFVRGAPEGLAVELKRKWKCGWYDLVSAYGQVKARTEPAIHMVSRRPVMTLEAAIEHLSAQLGIRKGWTDLASFLPKSQSNEFRKSALASTFAASLELARTGRAEIEQAETYAPVFVRRVS